ncbi:MAG: hypothetical protein MZV63_15150 [Marinilabiliales bacterium]|nr:hypothetical protein [Marinilabiliales bacterium]
MTVIPWRDEPMVLACPPQHRLAKEKKHHRASSSPASRSWASMPTS